MADIDRLPSVACGDHFVTNSLERGRQNRHVLGLVFDTQNLNSASKFISPESAEHLRRRFDSPLFALQIVARFR